MALNEKDREDLLRDGKNMVYRGECLIDGCTVLVGFRPAGQMSLYWGADPVFQFNQSGQLRRVFFDGQRLAAESGVLEKLVRQSRGGRVELARIPLEESAVGEILKRAATCAAQIERCAGDLDTSWRVVGEGDDEFRNRVTDWCRRNGRAPAIAESPHA